MKKSYLGAWSGALLLMGAACVVPTPAKAGTITVLSDNFSDTTVGETQTTVDSDFSTINGTNVDVLGNIGTVPSGLTFYEGICASSGSANCVDLGGTGGSYKGQLESIGLSLAPGTYYLSFDLTGPEGYLGSSAPFRNNSSETTVLLGQTACISSTTGCLFDSSYTLGPTDTSDGVVTNDLITVSTAGTYYVEFVNDTMNTAGDLLTNVSLTEAVPEPSTMLLLGSALLGLGGLTRFRKRASR